MYNPPELTDRLLQPGKTSVELAAEIEAATNVNNAERLVEEGGRGQEPDEGLRPQEVP